MTNDELRTTTGTVTDDRPLVSFLYELLRDRLPAGEVEALVQHVEAERSPVYFTNGHLARYAQLLTDRLQNVPQRGDIP